MHATRNPDGSFTFEGVRYRLADRADDEAVLDVIADESGATIGSIRLLDARSAEPRVEILPSPKDPAVVHAIVALLESPRGAVPLQ